MAAVSLLLLLFFSRVFPSTFDVLFQRHVLPPFVFPFGGLNPLPPMDVRTITLVSVIFWGSGLIFSRRCLRSSSGWGPVISRGFLLLAAGLLFFTLTILATIWLLAFLGGNIPPGPWGIYEGNHGPWRHVYDLRKLLGFTRLYPFDLIVLRSHIPDRQARQASRYSVHLGYLILLSFDVFTLLVDRLRTMDRRKFLK